MTLAYINASGEMLKRSPPKVSLLVEIIEKPVLSLLAKIFYRPGKDNKHIPCRTNPTTQSVSPFVLRSVGNHQSVHPVVAATLYSIPRLSASTAAIP